MWLMECLECFDLCNCFSLSICLNISVFIKLVTFFSLQMKVFVEGLSHLNKDIPQFKEHLRDFLVEIKVSPFDKLHGMYNIVMSYPHGSLALTTT